MRGGTAIAEALIGRVRFRLRPNAHGSLWSADDLSRSTAPTHLIVLPLFGDNDLSLGTALELAALARARAHTQRVILVFKGDRHVSDLTVDASCAAAQRAKHFLRHASDLITCPHKLDEDTLDWIAGFVRHHADQPWDKEGVLLARLARILDRRARWEPAERLLDLSCPAQDSDKRKHLSAASARAIGRFIGALAPRVLIATRLGLTDGMFDQRGALQAIRVDLSSNRLTLRCAARMFPYASYLDLGANALEHAALGHCDAVPARLMLHKNNLRSIDLTQPGGGTLVRLSLYRNRLTHLDLANQCQLTHLNLGANPIKVVPPDLQDLPFLDTLGLARTEVSALPEWLVESSALRTLDISHIECRLPPAQLDKLTANGVHLIKRPPVPHDAF